MIKFDVNNVGPLTSERHNIEWRIDSLLYSLVNWNIKQMASQSDPIWRFVSACN